MKSSGLGFSNKGTSFPKILLVLNFIIYSYHKFCFMGDFEYVWYRQIQRILRSSPNPTSTLDVIFLFRVSSQR